ncbi:MAG: hypothetical protein ACOH1K_00105 [Rhodoglobus sp.]
MRILLNLVLDCHPDDAWRAIRSPQVFRDVSYPLTQFTSLDADGFAPLWSEGDHRVAVSALGLVTIGEQLIRISFAEPNPQTRLMRDSGGGLSGALAVVTDWQHSMAISAAPGGKTRYRDELRFRAGIMTLPLWPMYWAFWQWRAFAMKRLASGWAQR